MGTAMTESPSLRVHLLGAFRVLVDGQVVPERAWRSSRAASLVKVLALAPSNRLHREQAMETLWPDFAPDAQANNLNVAASRARQALGTAGAPPGLFVSRIGDALILGPPAAVWVDVDAFEGGVAEGWRTQDPALFRLALALYVGDLLPEDPYETWAEGRRAALRAAYLVALSRLGQLHAERGEIGYAVETTQRLVAAEPTQEEGRVALMRLYARSGQPARAIAQYDRLAAALRRDLDAEPDLAATELAGAIRDGRYPAPSERIEEDRPAGGSGRPVGAGDLPRPLSDLVGRQRELAEVRQLLETGRLVTLTGPGGVGKTRLGLAVADEVGASFAGGVAFVDLSPVRDPGLVLSTVAQVLDVRDPSGRATIGGVATHLADRRLLLLLDNFEQVVDAAPLVTALLERTRELKVLVTSRVALRVTGEREYPLPPLALPALEGAPNDAALLNAPAVALFVQRARETKPDFTPTSNNAGTVAEVCHRLGGLPLAIELAAARVKVLTPTAMLARLDRPLALLVGGRRDLPPRQQTIRATIAWSYDLLSPPEQRLLRRLSVFVGGWTLEAAEAVADLIGAPSTDPQLVLGIAVLDGLASLVDKSLVSQRELPGGEARFEMQETVRGFADERLSGAVDEGAVRDCHAAFAVALAEQAKPHLASAELARWLGRLDREDGNLRAALRWLRERGDAEPALRLVTALRLFWFIRGRLAEGCDETLAVAALPGSAAFPALRADALTSAGFLAREYGDYTRAQAASAAARAASEELGDRQRAADALANLGYVALQCGDYDAARGLFGECLATNRELSNLQGIADSLSFLALTAYDENDLDAARRLNEETLAIWAALGDRQAEVWARTRLGRVLLRQGTYADAFDEFVGSLAIARELDFLWGLSWALDGLAHLATIRGSWHLAVDLAAATASIREAGGLRLPPTEQAEVDRLRDRLVLVLGADVVAAALARRQRQTIDELTHAVDRALGS